MCWVVWVWVGRPFLGANNALDCDSPEERKHIKHCINITTQTLYTSNFPFTTVRKRNFLDVETNKCEHRLNSSPMC